MIVSSNEKFTSLYTEHGQLKTALSEAMDRWTEASEALSEASAS